MIRAALAGTVSAGMLALSLVAAETKPKRAATQAFMQQKLAWSQAVLEGLALEKFDLVSKNAIRMREMTQSNQWFTVKQPDYLAQTTNFQRSVDALYMAAVDKNLEVATEAYTKVARNCVECHRLVRVDQRKSAALPARTKIDLDLRPVIAQ
jgi:uncharacterized Fe-S radical SAM superfamily protein PflX